MQKNRSGSSIFLLFLFCWNLSGAIFAQQEEEPGIAFYLKQNLLTDLSTPELKNKFLTVLHAEIEFEPEWMQAHRSKILEKLQGVLLGFSWQDSKMVGAMSPKLLDLAHHDWLQPVLFEHTRALITPLRLGARHRDIKKFINLERLIIVEPQPTALQD
jgi:hypothetical protein